MAIKLRGEKRKEAEAAFGVAKDTQTIYWDALSKLEGVLGFEISELDDLESKDLDALIKEHNIWEEDEVETKEKGE